MELFIGQLRKCGIAALAIAFVLAIAFLLPTGAQAQENEQDAAQSQPQSEDQESTEKTVRVGWYESAFNTTDQYGQRSGYAYEYQRKIAAYAGWTYEYVEGGSWAECMQMLKDGKIDLMSDVSYVPERTADMLYCSFPMGEEVYYIFVPTKDAGVVESDLSSLNGKRLGVMQGSIQQGMARDWLDKNGITAELIELTCSEEEAFSLVRSGSLDAFITLDAYGDPDVTIPAVQIGSSDFFFVVNKDRPDLLSELDAAMNSIQKENNHYNHELHEKYFKSYETSFYLSADEIEWLTKHGTIRVGYQDNYLSFCAKDPDTGELTGALKDYLAYASTAFENAKIDFQPVAYPTAAALIEALKKGEVDCVFPVNLNEYSSEMLGVALTPLLMRSEMDAVVRAADQKEFLTKEQVVVAVNEGNTNYEKWLLNNFPNWKIELFPDTSSALNAIADGKADCIVISNYRLSNIAKQCERLHLTTVNTGIDMGYYLAVRQGDTKLYSILAKLTSIVPNSVTNRALTYYSAEDAKTSFIDFILDHLLAVMVTIVVILLVIVLLLLRSIRAERKAREEEHLVDDLNKRVFVDALTSVRNKGAYDEYLQGLQDKLDAGESFGVAVGIFDCDDLKQVNDQCGHDKGDEYLKVASRLICRVFQHSAVFRIGGDEFAAILLGEDFKNRVELMESFDKAQAEANGAAEDIWKEAHVALGIAVYDAHLDRSLAETARRADKVMYENKRIGKAARGL